MERNNTGMDAIALATSVIISISTSLSTWGIDFLVRIIWFSNNLSGPPRWEVDTSIEHNSTPRLKVFGVFIHISSHYTVAPLREALIVLDDFGALVTENPTVLSWCFYDPKVVELQALGTRDQSCAPQICTELLKRYLGRLTTYSKYSLKYPLGKGFMKCSVLCNWSQAYCCYTQVHGRSITISKCNHIVFHLEKLLRLGMWSWYCAVTVSDKLVCLAPIRTL